MAAPSPWAPGCKRARPQTDVRTRRLCQEGRGPPPGHGPAPPCPPAACHVLRALCPIREAAVRAGRRAGRGSSLASHRQGPAHGEGPPPFQGPAAPPRTQRAGAGRQSPPGGPGPISAPPWAPAQPSQSRHGRTRSQTPAAASVTGRSQGLASPWARLLHALGRPRAAGTPLCWPRR